MVMELLARRAARQAHRARRHALPSRDGPHHRARLPARCSARTTRASSTAISSPRTSSSSARPTTTTRSPRCSTSASRRSRRRPGEEGLTSSTKTGAVLGTPYYMSPEQARGLRNIDHRSDLWSLGVIAHKCVTGRLAVRGRERRRPARQDLHLAPPRPVGDGARPARLPSTHGSPRRSSATRRDASGRASELSDALALAAGLSARGPASSHDGGTFGSTPIGAVGVATARSPVALTAAGVTSSPFTASAQPPSSPGGCSSPSSQRRWWVDRSASSPWSSWPPAPGPTRAPRAPVRRPPRA